MKPFNQLTDGELAAMAREINAKKAEKLERYGITLKDVEDARREGYKAGHEKGYTEGVAKGIKRKVDEQISSAIMEKVYAAVALELRDRKYSSLRIVNFLRGVNHRVVYALDDLELCDEVLEKCGITFNMRDPMEQVQEGNPKKAMSIRKFQDWSKVRKSKLLHHFKP